MWLEDHVQALERRWAVDIHCNCPLPASWHSGHEGYAETEDPEVEDLEALAEDRVPRNSQEHWHEGCPEVSDLEAAKAAFESTVVDCV